VALAAILLVSGFALANPPTSIDLPANGPFTISAVVLPGEFGGHVYAIRGGTFIEKEDLSIDFGDDGYLAAFGEVVCSYDAQHEITVTADYAFDGERWRCDVEVRDMTANTVLYTEDGIDMGATAPDECEAAAQSVFLLAAE
jgi:hypothetical protein